MFHANMPSRAGCVDELSVADGDTDVRGVRRDGHEGAASRTASEGLLAPEALPARKMTVTICLTVCYEDVKA